MMTLEEMMQRAIEEAEKESHYYEDKNRFYNGFVNGMAEVIAWLYPERRSIYYALEIKDKVKELREIESKDDKREEE